MFVKVVKSKRESNIELLRIVLMFMIITHHIIVHGFGLKNLEQSNYEISSSSYIIIFVECFVVIAVNTFVFISGYFGIKFRLTTILSFIFQALIYSIFIFFIFYYLNPPTKWRWLPFIYSLIPISTNLWWFLSAFLGLYFIAPFINKGVELINRKELQVLLVGLLFFDCFAGFLFNTFSASGYTVSHLLTIYLVGRYINIYKLNIRNPLRYLVLLSLLLFVCCVLVLKLDRLNFIWVALGYTKFSVVFKLFYYNNPILILSSILLFFTFKNLKIQSSVINVVSSSVFGIYLIHDHIFVRDEISQFVRQLKVEYSGIILGVFITTLIFVIFTLAVLIELGRKYLFDGLTNKLIDRIDKEIVERHSKLVSVNLPNER